MSTTGPVSPTDGDGLITIPTHRRWFRPEEPAWMRGVVTLILIGILLALILLNRDTGPGWSAIVGLTGAAVGYFFKK